MDKVKAVLKYKFWILFGLLLPVIIVGYVTASTPLQTEIFKRSSELKTTADSVDKSFATTPNETYQTGLAAIADRLESDNAAAKRVIWETQLKDMNWPGVIADLMEKKGLRGERAIEKYTSDPLITERRKYAETYELQAEALFKHFEPFVGDQYKGRDTDWTQKVLMTENTLPIPPIVKGKNVTAEQMWNAQEDIWLVRVIGDVIRSMNEEAEGINQSAIRRIDKFRLFGATGVPVLAGATAAVGGDPYGGGEYGDPYGEGYGDPYGGGGFGGPVGGKSSVDFDPAEEFGPSSEGGAATAYSDYESYDETGLGAAVAPPKRYIGDESEGIPFKERGFYMTALVEQGRVDDFLASLSSARWPVRIARFQIGPNPYFREEIKTPAAGAIPGGGFGGGYPGGGYPGGGYPGGGYPGGGYPGGGYPGGGYPGEDTGEGYDEYGGGEYDEYGEFGGGGGEFGVAAGTAAAVNDPIAASAVASPDLVMLAVAGAITIYSQPPVDVVADPMAYPVPIEGQPYQPPQPDGGATNEVAMAASKDES